MLTTEILTKKRDGHRLSRDEIRFLIEGFTAGSVADYQMAAFTMAVCVRGMDADEAADLTAAMLNSGRQLPREGQRPRLDKHSTGGLGDKISLILAPLWAACDVDVPMISGRGLGITGGTLDKLDAIPGFQTSASIADSSRWLAAAGAFIVGADESIAPADRRLYAIRDVTATVESVALITASILSKKLAASLDALVMDVKVGRGAFMTDLPSATRLAESLIDVGRRNGLPIAASITDMDQPLGWAVGNAIEVNESIDVLAGQPGPVRDLTLHLAARGLELIESGGQPATKRDPAAYEYALAKATQRLDDGSAMERWQRMLASQTGTDNGRSPGSNRRDAGEKLPLASASVIQADRNGTVQSVDARQIGLAVIESGGGRRTMDDILDSSVGVHVHVRVGDDVQAGDRLLTLHSDRPDDSLARLNNAVTLGDASVADRPLIIESLPIGTSS